MALAVLTGLFQLVLVGVLVARDVTTFLAFWELMTLVPGGGDPGAHGDSPRPGATVFEYLAITHIGGAGVWVAMIVLAGYGGPSGDPARARDGRGGDRPSWPSPGSSASGPRPAWCRFHAWLPRVHPLAPSHVSALMSGVMVNVGLYGLMRLLLEWLGGPALWMGLIVLALGAVSALTGVVYALLPARPEAAAGLLHDRERGHHRPSRSAPRRSSVAAARTNGPPSPLGAALLHGSTTRRRRRCCSSAPGRWSAPGRASTSTAWAACWLVCPAPARPSWSGR